MARPTGRERQWPLYITIGSTTYPFPIMNNENGVPVWNVDRVPDLMGQGSDLDYQERGYRSFHSGMGWGQHLVDNVYHGAINMDMRFPMQGIRGPLITSITALPELLSNTGFETAGSGGTDVFGTWDETAGDGEIARVTTPDPVHGGTYGANLTSGPNRNTKVAQTISGLVAQAKYTVSFWTYSAAGGGLARYGIYDVSNGADITAITAVAVGQDSTWRETSVEITTPAGCTSIRLDLWCGATENDEVYFDDASIVRSSKNATVGVTGLFEKGTKIYAISGKWVNEITPSTDALTNTASFPYDLTTSNTGAIGTVGVNFDGNVIIGVTTASNANMVSFDGTNFDVLADNSPPKGAYLARYWEDSDWRLAVTYLAGGTTPSVAWMAQGADPEDNPLPWSAAYGVGDTSSTLTGIAAHERTLYIGASDGLYVLDGQAGRAPLLIPAMPRDSTNGVNLAISPDGNVWYPTVAGLYLFDPNQGTIDDVTPGRGLPHRSVVQGTVTAITFFRAWTYLALYDGTHSYIMAGRRREEGEPGFGPYIWHGALAKISSTKVTSMLVSSLTTPPRLWLGLLSGNVAYFRLPSKGDNPLLDSTYRYTTAAGYLYIGADDMGIPGMRWNIQDVVVEGYGLSATKTLSVYERRDANQLDDASTGWVALQTGIATDGRTVISPTGDKRFSRVEWGIMLANSDADSTVTHIVRSLAAKAARRATKKDLISTTILLSDEAISRLGIQNRYAVDTLATQLDTLDALNPVTVKHFFLTGSGSSITALVTNIRKRVVQQKGDSAASLAYDLTLKVVS